MSIKEEIYKNNIFILDKINETKIKCIKNSIAIAHGITPPYPELLKSKTSSYNEVDYDHKGIIML